MERRGRAHAREREAGEERPPHSAEARPRLRSLREDMVARGNETRHDATGERMSEGEDPGRGRMRAMAERTLRCLVGWAGGEGGAPGRP